MKSIAFWVQVFLGIVCAAGAAAERIYEPPVVPDGNFAASASPRLDWYEGVQKKFDESRKQPVHLIFDGDSITNRWPHTGKAMWERHFSSRGAYSFGIEGDRTENLLWRLEKGQVEGLDPKLVVLMIGTNNSGRDTAEQIAAGIHSVVKEYLKRCPNAHVLLMGIFPRGEKAEDGGRKKVAAVNALIEPYAKSPRVTYIDISEKMIGSDGTISKEMMPDAVHPTDKGYEIWAEAILPVVEKYVPAQQ